MCEHCEPLQTRLSIDNPPAEVWERELLNSLEELKDCDAYFLVALTASEDGLRARTYGVAGTNPSGPVTMGPLCAEVNRYGAMLQNELEAWVEELEDE